MKLLFKFFIWQIDFKTKKLDEDEKIKFLANELLKAVQASGRIIAHPEISKGFGSVDVAVHNFGTKDADLRVQCVTNRWEVKTKPTFKTLEVAK